MINFKRYIRNYNLILNIIYWYGVFIFIHCRCWQSFNSNNIICRALMWLFHVRLFWIPWKMPRHAQSWVWIKVLRLNKTTDGWQLLVWLVVWIFFMTFHSVGNFFIIPTVTFTPWFFRGVGIPNHQAVVELSIFVDPDGAVEAPSFQRLVATSWFSIIDRVSCFYPPLWIPPINVSECIDIYIYNHIYIYT